MRILSCGLGLVVSLLASRADADVSKAMAAARDNLPADTQVVVAIDVAAVAKSPLFQQAVDAIKAEERDFAEAHALVRTACGFDPLTVVEGAVIAAAPESGAGIVFLQLSIDRTKASACLQSSLAAVGKNKGGKLTIKQDGNYTVASNGTGPRDSAYFPWIGANVVAISFKPDHKDAVDAWFGQKTFAKSAVAALAGKLDAKSVVAGAFANRGGKPIDRSVPITQAYGNLTLAGGKLSGQLVATAVDAKAAATFASESNSELQRAVKRDRTPAALKKLLAGVKIVAAGSDVTISGTTTEKELGATLGELFVKKQKKAANPADTAAAIAKMDEFAKKMCACKDKACADKVNADMTRWGTEMAKKTDSGGKLDDASMKRMTDAATRYGECMTKTMTPPKP